MKVDYTIPLLIAQDNEIIFQRDGQFVDKTRCFDFDGMTIHNPFMEDTGSFDVDPIEYYGESFLNSGFVTVLSERIQEQYFRKHYLYQIGMEIKEAVNHLLKANKIWEEHQLIIEKNDKMEHIKFYPFSKDFLEEIYAINDWANSLIKS